MEWTKETPTENGLYWIYVEEPDQPKCCQVHFGQYEKEWSAWLQSGAWSLSSKYADLFTIHWQGPIVRPTPPVLPTDRR